MDIVEEEDDSQRGESTTQLMGKPGVRPRFVTSSMEAFLVSVQFILTNATFHIFKLVACCSYQLLCSLQRLNEGTDLSFVTPGTEIIVKEEIDFYRLGYREQLK